MSNLPTEINNANEEGGVVLSQEIVRETDDFLVVKEDGKFVRKAKYQNYSSITAETKEDKIWLMGLIENDEDTGNGLKNQIGKEIEVSDIITRTYDKINENNGQMEYGVITYLITPSKQAFATSSKNVYFTVRRMMEMFGKPHETEDWKVKVKVYKEKATNGDMVKIKVIG